MILASVRCICGGAVDKQSEAGPLRCVDCGMVAMIDTGRASQEATRLVFTLATAREARACLRAGTLRWEYPEP